MIRINLLPIKQDRRREAARSQLIFTALILLIEFGVFFILHFNVSTDLDKQQNQNNMIRANAERLESQVQDHQKILDEIAEFEKRQAAIDSLQEARTGPVFVMLELSKILSYKGKPFIDNDKYQELIQVDPASGYDENWDYRRVWINSFSEKNRDVSISGQALTHEDVAEFLKRINLSGFFVSSELISTTLVLPQGFPSKAALAKADLVVLFSMTGTVKYR